MKGKISFGSAETHNTSYSLKTVRIVGSYSTLSLLFKFFFKILRPQSKAILLSSRISSNGSTTALVRRTCLRAIHTKDPIIEVVPKPPSSTYRPPTPPAGIPLSKIISANNFPLSFSDAFAQWKVRHDIKRAEFDVLSTLPFFPDPDATRSAQSLSVDIGNGNWVNEFEVTQLDTETKNDIVVLHGYGAGLAFFYRNFDALSSRPGWKLHALDLLGYGCSARPPFKIKSKDPYERIHETEDFFIDAIEAWRKAKGIERFTFVAHSMGAYFASAYSMKYPGHIKKLVLVSPAGVPRSSLSISSIARRKLSSKTTSEVTGEKLIKVPAWFNFLWECHVSPFSLVRNTGPLGPKFVSGWTHRRFANLPPVEAEALHRYVYGIFNARGSGEYALNYLLAPGAYARWPLAERAANITCDTMWVYGQNDWMDRKGGEEACDNIAKAHGGKRPPMKIVSDAGHHIYLDNPKEFNELVLDVMREVEDKE